MNIFKFIVEKLTSLFRDKGQNVALIPQVPDLKLMKKIRILYCFLSFFLLFVGMSTYIFFRDRNIIRAAVLQFSEWVPCANINIANLPLKLRPSFVSHVLMFNLADMLWILSGILFLRFIWFYNIKMQNIYVFCMYGIALFLEITQLTNFSVGTFDWYDILFISIGAFIESLLFYFFIRRRFYEKTVDIAYSCNSGFSNVFNRRNWNRRLVSKLES